MKIKPIKTEKDYKSTLKVIQKLWDAEPDTPDGDTLDILVTLVEVYEKEHYPITRMRRVSGHVTSKSKLVSFLYILMRDHLPCGTVETMVSEEKNQKSLYTNGWLATYAKDLARRLK